MTTSRFDIVGNGYPYHPNILTSTECQTTFRAIQDASKATLYIQLNLHSHIETVGGWTPAMDARKWTDPPVNGWFYAMYHTSYNVSVDSGRWYEGLQAEPPLPTWVLLPDGAQFFRVNEIAHLKTPSAWEAALIPALLHERDATFRRIGGSLNDGVTHDGTFWTEDGYT
ncbi:uncharacterized protein BDZ99DRAFT_523765 [Mytilinidion resinicola]|uniref:Uncharacterized protein n=1 Tax=Mytilinidion resinicola TaxID=574789 RepID=A0A6A6YBV7_9PEZI|nr:uncharacterized protein BDZ99DRAFT_523765 [Mytilinidion resinicola]KAF2806306.1 hypothetical protein BDZ99DRAFT_523765 [Mytilinidion resinicola]